MKIKCERKGDKCTHCQTSGTECTFAPVERKPPKVKRPELLESMEQRIERMEAILSATCLQSKSSRATSPDDADDSGLAGGSTTILVTEDGTEKFVGKLKEFLPLLIELMAMKRVDICFVHFFLPRPPMACSSDRF